MNSKNQAIQITIVLYHIGVFAGYVHMMKNISAWGAIPLTLLMMWICVCFYTDDEEGKAEKDKLREEILRLRSLIK